MPAKKDKLEQLRAKIYDQTFWQDTENSKQVLQQIKQYEDLLKETKELDDKAAELEVLFELCSEDDSLETELAKEIERVYEEIENFSIKTMLNGKYDTNNAILQVHAGTGGRDAQDWTGMLLRMYTRFAANMHYKVSYLDMQQDDEEGIKSATLLLEGTYAYGYLKGEKGVHRLVRISPFDSSGRRHTSFASVDVMPQLNDDIKVDINPKDLKIDTYRSSGAGGQHVNKTDSAVRITHLPTGVVVQCQNERSQHSNKEQAMKMLISKLITIKEQEHKEKIEDISGQYSQIAWGSQIRSYVFQPYTLVKDHRTGAETGNIQAVMDGDIMLFIRAYFEQGPDKTA